jgi:hypothetical protein
MRGWGQVEAAQLLTGIDQPLLSQIERETVVPSPELQAHIREVYGWTDEVDAALDVIERAIREGK